VNVCVIIEGDEVFLNADDREGRYRIGDRYRPKANEEHAARFDVHFSEFEF